MCKFKHIIIVLLSILLLVGCSNSETYEKAIEEGKLSIVSGNYETAEKMFSLAIEENKNDKEAKGLYEQTKKLIQLNELYEENEIEKSLKICEEILNIKTDSNVVKEEAKKIQEEINNKGGLLQGHFEKYLHYDTSMVKESVQADFIIHTEAGDDEEANVGIELDKQRGMQVILTLQGMEDNYLDNYVFPENAIDEKNNKLKKGYSVEIGIKDLNNDGCNDIVIACGDRKKELDINIIIIKGYAGEIEINNIGSIKGEKLAVFNDDGTIEVTYKSNKHSYTIDEIENKNTKEKENNVTTSDKNNETINSNTNAYKTLCPLCEKNYLEDNIEWIGEDKCDDCIRGIIEEHGNHHHCVVCGISTDKLCPYDECDAFCEDHIGYYCECGDFHHNQELCPMYYN